MYDKREMGEAAILERSAHLTYGPRARTQSARQLAPVLDHHHVSLQRSHTAYDREIVSLGIDLENADAGRYLACIQERLQRAEHDRQGATPRYFVSVIALEQCVTK